MDSPFVVGQAYSGLRNFCDGRKHGFPKIQPAALSKPQQFGFNFNGLGFLPDSPWFLQLFAVRPPSRPTAGPMSAAASASAASSPCPTPAGG
jgi:hypothetical protein